ncbi:hypothetical protein Emtol_4232 [Emticicia oligotrophica DSM 17448]|uniref:Outer membrane lipoprotein-sorting protein n=1 Tax=Emticicia oligotrophica (strain DSM 17448 / CIP 109782 / MTCC 6937 / GPTSA100-15) TaxID=929562 RepID=A0ABM5N740_EMTOG|nr:hypothetical protein [Emticicia oligotrophica]AFK05356.1 hypothetical protein Emtol_4232 [Emticicia oligotrophica DSM 17448]
MKKLFVTLLSLITYGTFAQDTPSADAIIDKFLTAIGGKDAIAKIQDITISSTSETQRGTSETEIKYKFPDRYSMSVYANGNEVMSSTYDGNRLKSGGFMGGGGGGNRAPIEGQAAQLMAMRSNPFMETMYDKLGVTRTVVGKEKVGDKDAYKLELTTPDGRKWNDYFDVETGLKVKTYSMNETPRGKFENIVSYQNYKKFKGVEVMLPSQTKRTAGQMGEITSEVQSVKVNKGLKDSDFVIKD